MKGSVMTARLLMALSASILLTLGTMHLVYTFWGTSLAYRDPALQVSMSRISPVLTKETTMWRCWMGFNASHSMGLILFGLTFRISTFLCWWEVGFLSMTGANTILMSICARSKRLSSGQLVFWDTDSHCI